MGLDVTPEEIRLFLDETAEKLEELDHGLLALEHNPRDQEAVARVFRAAHTIKGSAGTVGLTSMSELCHLMEDVFDAVRAERIDLSGEEITTLLWGVDTLRGITQVLSENAAAGGELVDDPAAVPADLLAALRRITGAASAGGGARGSGAAGAGQVRATAYGSSFVKPDDDGGEGHENGQLLEVEAVFAADAVMPAVRALQLLLMIEGMGDVVRSEPTPDEIDREEVRDRFWALVRTSVRPQDIEAAMASTPEVAVVRVRPAGGTDGAAERREPVSGAGEAGSGGTPARAGAEPGRAAELGHTIRVDTGILDEIMNLVGELVIDRNRLGQSTATLMQSGEHDELAAGLNEIVAHMARTTQTLQEKIMRARMMPIDTLFKKFPRMVRDLAHKSGKEVELIVDGQDTEIDRSVIEVIGDPLIHLIRNAIDHGIEEPEARQAAGKPPVGRVLLRAEHQESHIVITVADDGRGIDLEQVRRSAVTRGLISEGQAARLGEQEVLDLIFLPGLSTTEQVTEVSGRGVGMDVVRRNIERINGTITVETEAGGGTAWVIRLPLSLATLRGLLVEAAGQLWALPIATITEIRQVSARDLHSVMGRPAMVVRGRVVPVWTLAEAMGLPDMSNDGPQAGGAAAGAGAGSPGGYIVLCQVSNHLVGLAVDRLFGEQEVVIKSLGQYLGEIPGLSGATILGDGTIALIVDIAHLAQVLSRQAGRKVAESVG